MTRSRSASEARSQSPREARAGPLISFQPNEFAPRSHAPSFRGGGEEPAEGVDQPRLLRLAERFEEPGELIRAGPALRQHDELAGGLVVLHVPVGRDDVVQTEDPVDGGR